MAKRIISRKEAIRWEKSSSASDSWRSVMEEVESAVPGGDDSRVVDLLGEGFLALSDLAMEENARSWGRYQKTPFWGSGDLDFCDEVGWF